MIRTKLWFRCAAMHDPVTPTILKPAVISWEAKNRIVDLTIERAFKGDELVMRMKGWVTVDVKKAIQIVKKRGRLKVLDDRELVLELESEEDFEALSGELAETFGDQLNMERL
ncbi:MAG: hypothetical protein GY846_17380 [Deltaproteobacteria bacterium]|nr:hypothetical protein [Deltaproteobacteria bacterium]